MKAKRGVIRPLAALAVLLAVVVFVAQWDTAKATYNPAMSASVSDASAGANADVNTTFSIPGGDFNFDVAITFTPPEFGMGATDIPLGAYVADLHSDSTLGLLNNVCVTALPVSFKMLKATTNTADTISFADGFADLDGNTLPDAVDKYPDFLNTMFPGLTPMARSYGQTSVAGTPMSMNFVVFEPGTAILGIPFDASLGYGSVSVLNDPTTEVQPGSITDSCTPLANNITRFGITKDNSETAADESGYVGSTNPTGGGDYTFTTFSRSQGDADGDDIENDLDTCPFDINEGDPRVQGSGDPDNDGIDNVCDPTPDEADTDVDGDIYLNRGDNCPLISNPDNADADGDRIGDACDPHPDTVDGEGIDVTLTATVTIAGRMVSLSMGWNDSCYSGSAQPVEAAVGDIAGHVMAIYRLRPDQGFDRWFPGRADISTIISVNPYDPLIILMAADVGWLMEITTPPAGPPELLADWNRVCYTGPTLPVEEATADWDDFAALYMLQSETQAWCRYFPDRPDISNCTDLTTFDSVFVLVAEAPELCGPILPTTFNGTVTVDDEPATDGTFISAIGSDGITWAQVTTSDGSYVMNVPYAMAVTEPCFPGGSLSFELKNGSCEESAECVSGLQDLDLTCATSCELGTDTDEDGFDNDVECYLGTHPLDACPDEPSDDAWPLDIDMNRDVSVTGDVFYYRGSIGATPGDPEWWQRLDLDMNGDISVTGDVYLYRGRIGETCT